MMRYIVISNAFLGYIYVFIYRRNQALKFLERQYFDLTGANLKIFGISTKILKDYVTSERDYLRGISRMPGPEFRLWEEDYN